MTAATSPSSTVLGSRLVAADALVVVDGDRNVRLLEAGQGPGEVLAVIESFETGPQTREVAVSGDGQVIYFHGLTRVGDPACNGGAGDTAIFTTSAVDEGSLLVHGGNPSLSPDGRYLAYVRRSGFANDANSCAGLVDELVVRDLASGTEQSWVTTDDTSRRTRISVGAPSWAPDSIHLSALLGEINRETSIRTVAVGQGTASLVDQPGIDIESNFAWIGMFSDETHVGVQRDEGGDGGLVVEIDSSGLVQELGRINGDLYLPGNWRGALLGGSRSDAATGTVQISVGMPDSDQTNLWTRSGTELAARVVPGELFDLAAP